MAQHIKPGDVVLRSPAVKKPKHNRNGIGGNAAYWLSVNTPYCVKAVSPTGGLILQGFKLTVSVHDVILQQN